MNIEKYTKIISRYNNVYNAKAHDTNIIVLPFSEFKWNSKFLSRIQKFDKVVYNCKRPIVKAFKSFYRTDCITTVFLQNKTHSIIMGNERILFSHPEGNIFLCLTPFWVTDASFIHLLGSDNIFPYKNVVLFLDELQIPYPGGSYYCKNRSETIAVEPSNIDKYMRICFITRDLSTLEDMFITWNGRPNVKNFPFLTKSTILTISKFIDPSPIKINFQNFPEKVIKSTNLISKRLSRKDPNFLIQDILNTYRNSSGSIDNVGLFIEYPFECDYENSCGNGGIGSACTPIVERRSNDKIEQYAAFYVNGLNPKKILQVRRPYDRYLEYENYVPEIDMHSWTNILYDPGEILPMDVSRVILDNTILGYKYNNVFLCLPFPGLSNGGDGGGGNFICGSTSQTDCLLTPMKEVDLLNDGNIYVIDDYPYDDDHKLYQIQHRGIRNDLWCLGSKNSKEEYTNANGEPPSKYPRKADPPLFVTKWLQFYNENKDKRDLNFGELDEFKLSLILARHKICFKLNRGDKREIKLLNGEYEIRLEEQLVNYINEIRLLPLDSSNTITETNTNGEVNDENFVNNDDDDSNQDEWCRIS